MKYIGLIVTTVISLVAVFAVSAQSSSDGRINVAHHFGGDTLYCDQAQGCWLLNSNGEQLWEVSQSTIDTVMTDACETGQSHYIEAGIGTYGLSTFRVSCYVGYDPALTLIGFDEHGNVNEMEFSPSYLPVNPPAPVVEVTVEPAITVTSVPIIVGECTKATPEFCEATPPIIICERCEIETLPVVLEETTMVEEVTMLEEAVSEEVAALVVSESKTGSR